MHFQKKHFHCSDHLLATLERPIDEIFACIKTVPWQQEFSVQLPHGKTIHHQAAYNKALQDLFDKHGWECQPVLASSPKLIGDFRKRLVFVEVQFGNSAALYRDYYKFQYGLANGLLSLAVLIVPTAPVNFFPSRPDSVRNMAEYDLADRFFTMLPIRVPTLLIGLLPGAEDEP
jgi:hypothetical protein